MEYSAFGMRIRSDIRLQLPRAAALPPPGSPAPWLVDIVYGAVPGTPELPNAIGAVRYGAVAAPGAGCLRVAVPRVARYQIQGLSRIVVEPEPGADEQRVGLFISSLILGFLIKQTPVITLHGSAVSKDARAMVFIGSRGSGKSTLAAALAGVGYRMLCDDMVPVARGPAVLPGIPQAKLLPDAFARLVGDPAAAGHLFDGVDKFHADVGGSLQPARLAVIFALEMRPPGQPGAGGISVEPVTGARKLQLLVRHMTGITGIDDAAEQFVRATRRLGPAPVLRVSRSRESDPAAVCELIMAAHARHGRAV